MAGHHVEMLGDAARAAGVVDERQIDLVVLEVPAGLPEALEPVRELRARYGCLDVRHRLASARLQQREHLRRDDGLLALSDPRRVLKQLSGLQPATMRHHRERQL